jgi:hypothetical protein
LSDDAKSTDPSSVEVVGAAGRTLRAGTPPAADHPRVTFGIGRAAGAG